MSKMRLHEVQLQQTCLTQKSIEMFISTLKFYTNSSMEYTSKMPILVPLFMDSGYPMNMLENEAFRSFCKAMDPRFEVPTEARSTRAVQAVFEANSNQL